MATILLVDDEEGVRYVLSSILKRKGDVILTAGDGKTCLELLDENYPDLVFLDIHLPDMDGLQILAEIKKKYKNLPVVMCSGFDKADFAVQAVQAGAFAYISKPFEYEEVLRIAKKALESGKKEVLLKKKKAVSKKAVVVRPWVAGLILIGLIVGVVFLAISAIKFIGKGKETEKVIRKEIKDVKNFVITYSHPTGLSFDGKHLWSADWFNQSIYKHNLDDKLFVNKFYYLPGKSSSGLAFGQECLWSSDATTAKIYKHKLDEALSVIAEYGAPGQNPCGLLWDGANLWSCDSDLMKIYKHKMDDKLSVATSYDSPGASPVGLFWDGKHIWSADSQTNTIYKHNIDMLLSVVAIYQLDSYLEKEEKIAGITWDGFNIWLSIEDKGKIYCFSFQDKQ